jgi:hypothetical protein
MSTTTPILGLNKPQMADAISTSIPQLAANFDLLDAATAKIYWSGSQSDLVVATTPGSATAVDSMSITIPASTSPRMAIIQASVWFIATHTNRFLISLDGTMQDGSQSMTGHASGGDSSNYDWNLANFLITIPGDNAAHTITIQYDAVDATTQTTFKARSMSIMLLNTTTSPATI